jgi:hypothetical protein
MTRPDDERRRALALLAENPDGCSRAIMLARGCRFRCSIDWFALGSQRRTSNAMSAATMRVKITEPGRRALQ